VKKQDKFYEYIFESLIGSVNFYFHEGYYFLDDEIFRMITREELIDGVRNKKEVIRKYLSETYGLLSYEVDPITIKYYDYIVSNFPI
jgi:hypothetical protein